MGCWGERKSVMFIGVPWGHARRAWPNRSKYGPRSVFLVRRPQTVADAGLGQNIVRALGIGFDLLPELPHIDPQVLRVREVIPQLAEKELVGEHLAGMLHQHAQKLVLLGGEL